MSPPPSIPVQRAERDIRENFVAWRKLRGLTVQQVADRSGVSENTVRRFLKDPGSISVENMLRIARSVGILDQLVAATDPLSTDIGRLRAGENLPQRVRHPGGKGDV